MRFDRAPQESSIIPVGLPPEARVIDRRRHQRVGVSLLGRYMLADRQEYPCQVTDISPGGRRARRARDRRAW